MNQYLLFIDTEASGLPKNWNLPYDSPGNWPHCVQISWVVYAENGAEIKKENHFVKDNDFEIAASATRIHGITREDLNTKGEYREGILKRLSEDLHSFEPLVVGHFMQFDLHLLRADFLRAGMEDATLKLPIFCTMLGSIHLVKNPAVKFLRLEQLYLILFNQTLTNPHDALVDATATAACFFELVKRGEIDDEIIAGQQKEFFQKVALPDRYGCLPLIAFIVVTVLIFFYA